MLGENVGQCIAARPNRRMNSPQPSQKDYRVTLDAFEGPLDLLLFLVRRAEVDLQDIPDCGDYGSVSGRAAPYRGRRCGY